MTTAGRPSPLAASLARLGTGPELHLPPELRVGVPAGADWLGRDDLLPGPALDDLMGRVAGAAGCDDPRLVGTFLLEGYAWSLAAPALAAHLAEGRLPDVGADVTAARLDRDGRAVALAYRSPRHGTRRGTPAANHPDAVPFDDDAALLGWFRGRLVEHLGPVVDAVAPRARRGPRALWASVEDCVTGALTWLGDSLGCGDRARGHAALLLGVDPLRGPATFRATDGGVVRMRVGCCQSFRAPGGALCSTCPRAGRS